MKYLFSQCFAAFCSAEEIEVVFCRKSDSDNRNIMRDDYAVKEVWNALQLGALHGMCGSVYICMRFDIRRCRRGGGSRPKYL